MQFKKITQIIKLSILFLTLASLPQSLNAQTVEDLPYSKLEDIEGDYSAGRVAARLVDGLGFRFYWATEGLKEEDINIKQKADVRSIQENVDHIYELTMLITNSVFNEKNRVDLELSFIDKRKKILLNLERVSNRLFNSTDEQIEDYSIKFNGRSVLPFYNMINGPISDAIWHCGQIVMLRRMAGNPFNSKVSLLHGRVRD